MLHSRHVGAILCVALATSGCSSRPRHFTPRLNPPVSDANAFERDMSVCRDLVGKGYKSGFKDAAVKIGGGTAIGLGTGAAIAAAGPPTFATLGVASYAFPIVGFVAGFGISRAIRSGREKKLKTALTDCMSEYGHTVEEWEPTKRPKLVAKSPLAATRAVPPAESSPDVN